MRLTAVAPGAMHRALAPGEDQPRAVPRARAGERRQARAGERYAVDLAGGRANARTGARAAASATRSSARACRSRSDENLAGPRPARVSGEHRLAGPAAAAEHRQADPRRGRPGGRLRRCRRRAAPGQARVGAGRSSSCCAPSARSSALTSPRRYPRGAGWRRAPASSLHRARARAIVASACSCLPLAAELSTAAVYAEADRLGRGAHAACAGGAQARAARRARARRAAARRHGAAAQRPPARGRVAVSADRRRARSRRARPARSRRL